MALVIADRVKDTTTSVGTGTITLSGSPPAGFQSFAAVGDGNTTYYTIAGQGTAEWEVGIGTYTAAGTTLSRDTVLSSSAGGTTKVDFSAGIKDVFVTLPSERTVTSGATTDLVLPAPGTSGNVLTSDGTNWTSATPTSNGSTLTAVASGALSNGSPVVMNFSGTVSAVSGAGQTLGTSVVFRSAATSEIAVAYNTAQSRILIAYRDGGNSNVGTAIAGSVSGSSITFGTAVVISGSSVTQCKATYHAGAQRVVVVYREAGAVPANSGSASSVELSGSTVINRGSAKFSNNVVTNISATYDANADRIVVAYTDITNLSYGTAVVGTVLSTSLSFGTPVVFRSATTNSAAVAYDANTQKVVIAYTDGGNSNYGTAIVGTVSGTSISFGTPVVFESANTFAISIAYDSDTQKIVIAYRDGGNSNFGTAIVGTVSGTSISFGTASIFFAGYISATSIAYDPSIQRVVISYQDFNNSSYGTSVAGIVAGTNITFAQSTVFASVSASGIASVYAPNASRVVAAYTNGSNSYGTAVPFMAATSNLGSQNFIGFSNGAYTDGQTATIQIIGAVNNAQSGLVASQAYYVQAGGSLSRTPASPSVFAGTAVDSTKIIVKG